MRTTFLTLSGQRLGVRPYQKNPEWGSDRGSETFKICPNVAKLLRKFALFSSLSLESPRDSSGGFPSKTSQGRGT